MFHESSEVEFCIFKESPREIKGCKTSKNATWSEALDIISKLPEKASELILHFVDNVDISGAYNFNTDIVKISFLRSDDDTVYGIHGSVEFQSVDQVVSFVDSVGNLLSDLDVTIHLSGKNNTLSDPGGPYFLALSAVKSLSIYYENGVNNYQYVPAYWGVTPLNIFVHSPGNCVNKFRPINNILIPGDWDLRQAIYIVYYKVDQDTSELKYCIGSEITSSTRCKDATSVNWDDFLNHIQEKTADTLHLCFFDNVNVYGNINGNFKAIIIESIDNGSASGQLTIIKKDTYIYGKSNKDSNIYFLRSLDFIIHASGNPNNSNEVLLHTEVPINSADFCFDDISSISSSYTVFSTSENGSIYHPTVSANNQVNEKFVLIVTKANESSKYSYELSSSNSDNTPKSASTLIIISAVAVVVVLFIVIVVVMVIVWQRKKSGYDIPSTKSLLSAQ